MSRVKISEFRAKKLIDESYDGIEITPDSAKPKLNPAEKYVLKVDQAEKGRFKKGLVKLDVTVKTFSKQLGELQSKGYDYFLLESTQQHNADDEAYLSLSYNAGETTVFFSTKGGIDIESAKSTIKKWSYGQKTPIGVPKSVAQLVEKLVLRVAEAHIVFLEINPLVIDNDKLYILDCAMEVDDAAEFFVRGAWTSNDFRKPKGISSEQEKAVQQINEQSPASFNLNVLNPDGSIFVLLSGGGASLVLADALLETYGQSALANYGEYSGGPSRSETRQYTIQVLQLLVQSKSKEKTLVIGGGVANFTDVATTFQGIIDAFNDMKQQLQKQNLTVFVRRGGPRHKQGLQHIAVFFDSLGIPYSVQGPEVSLAHFVRHTMQEPVS